MSKPQDATGSNWDTVETKKFVLEFHLEEDVLAELAEFVRLNHLHQFRDAHLLFEKCLSYRTSWFPTRAEYADCLLRQGLYGTLARFCRNAKDTTDDPQERQLFVLIEVVANIHREMSFDNALEHLQDTWNFLPKSFKTIPKDVEIHLLEIYLQIAVLVEKHFKLLPIHMTQLPGVAHEGKWQGFKEWFSTLLGAQYFWEAHRILQFLIEIVSPEEAKPLLVEFFEETVRFKTKEGTADFGKADPSDGTEEQLGVAMSATIQNLIRCLVDRGLYSRLEWSDVAAMANIIAENWLLKNKDNCGSELHAMVTRAVEQLIWKKGETESVATEVVLNEDLIYQQHWNRQYLLSLFESGSSMPSRAQVLTPFQALGTVCDVMDDRLAAQEVQSIIYNYCQGVVNADKKQSVAVQEIHEFLDSSSLETGAVAAYGKRVGQTPAQPKNISRGISENKKMEVFDDMNWMDLHTAAYTGNEVVVQRILDNGIDVDVGKKGTGRTALHLAATNGQEKVMRLLLGRGADLHVRDHLGWTVLQHAVANGHETLVKLLLDWGAELDSRDRWGGTPLSYAVEQDHKAVVKLLVENIAELESKDSEYGQIPLSWAAEKGHEAIVRLLLEKGADVNAKMMEEVVEGGWKITGRTALHLAAEKGHEAIVRLLLEKGAGSRSPDNSYGDAQQGDQGDDLDEGKPRKRGRPPKGTKRGFAESPNRASLPPPMSSQTGLAPQVQTPQLQSTPFPQASPPQASPLKSTPTKATVIKALPTVRDHTTDQLNAEGDEYLPREIDEAGERKVTSTGHPLDGREYRCRTFFVPNRGDKLFMLATECARVLGYRDSYLLFNKNRSLYKIIATQAEKDDLIHQEILPYSYRSRQIAIVTARSMFRQFGNRLIVNGRRVRDDYWESKARKQGFTEEDAAGEKRPGAARARETAAAEANHGAHLAFAHPGAYIGSTQNYLGSTANPLQPFGGLGAAPGTIPLANPEPFNQRTTIDLQPQDYTNVQRPRHEISSVPYQDISRLTASGEILNQAAQAVEINKTLEQQRKSRKDYLDNIWHQPHEPAVQPNRPATAEGDSAPQVSQAVQSPHVPSANPAATGSSQYGVSAQTPQRSGSSSLGSQSYRPQPHPQSNMVPSPMAQPHTPLRPDQMHRRPPSLGMPQGMTASGMTLSGMMPGVQNPGHGYAAPHMWPQGPPQPSPLSQQHNMQQYAQRPPQRLLLEKGADVHAKMMEEVVESGWKITGRTALHLAAEKGHEAIVRLLLEKGADVHAMMMEEVEEVVEGGWRRITGRTALNLAAEGGADVNAEVVEGGRRITTRTALHLAAEKGHEAIVRLLLEHGCGR